MTHNTNLGQTLLETVRSLPPPHQEAILSSIVSVFENRNE
jgi:hypothetical protein